MWMHDFETKNGVRKMFYTDSPYTPGEVSEFSKNHRDDITFYCCDHFPCTIKEFLNGKSPKPYVTICNDSEEC